MSGKYNAKPWHHKFPACIKCNSKKRKYKARGLCEHCYYVERYTNHGEAMNVSQKIRRIRHHESIAKRVRAFQKAHPEKMQEYRRRSADRKRYGFTKGDLVTIPLLGRCEVLTRPQAPPGTPTQIRVKHALITVKGLRTGTVFTDIPAAEAADPEISSGPNRAHLLRGSARKAS